MSDVFNESDIVEAGTFGADAYHSIWHRGFHVTLTICQCAQLSAFPFNSAGERPRGAGSFIV